VGETVAMRGMDITLQPSQEERGVAVRPQTSGSSNRCTMALLRERNTKENHAKMVELGLIEESKQVGVKRKDPSVEGPLRRSLRVGQLAKVNYGETKVEQCSKKMGAVAGGGQVAKLVPRKSLRKFVSTDHATMAKNMDEVIYCCGCKQWVVPPCAAHGDRGMQFVHPDQLSLEVTKSKIRGAGQGLTNLGDTIVRGTLIGPYTGEFVSFEDYKLEEKEGRESGYAWLLYDSETLDKPHGYIDPGPVPDPALHKLAMANHPPKKADLCLVGCQYQGNIYYRATKDILQHQEVFVDYGPEYAAELGIDQSTYDTYSRPEDHKTVAIPCGTCGTTFSSQHFLNIHQQRCDTKSRIHCSETTCSKTFATKSSMVRHHNSIHLEKVFRCVDCGKTSSHRFHMKAHQRRVHYKEKPSKCSICGMAFSDNSDLAKHTKAVHLQEKPFKCSTCGLTFTRKCHLDSHTNAIHLGLRPHICKQCGATFTQATHLTKHFKSQHTTEQSAYTCPLTGCSVTYATNQGLKLHQLNHTGERPFSCPYAGCGMRFKTKGSVNKHSKSAKKHASDRLVSKSAVEQLMSFTCQVDGCANRFETEVERDRHMERLHVKD